MYDILTAIYYGELPSLRGKSPMKQPYSIAEQRIQNYLREMDPKTAEELRREIQVLALEQRDEAFQCGVRFGAQLTVQLLEDY